MSHTGLFFLTLLCLSQGTGDGGGERDSSCCRRNVYAAKTRKIPQAHGQEARRIYQELCRVHQGWCRKHGSVKRRASHAITFIPGLRFYPPSLMDGRRLAWETCGQPLANEPARAFHGVSNAQPGCDYYVGKRRNKSPLSFAKRLPHFRFHLAYYLGKQNPEKVLSATELSSNIARRCRPPCGAPLSSLLRYLPSSCTRTRVPCPRAPLTSPEIFRRPVLVRTRLLTTVSPSRP